MWKRTFAKVAAGLGAFALPLFVSGIASAEPGDVFTGDAEESVTFTTFTLDEVTCTITASSTSVEQESVPGEEDGPTRYEGTSVTEVGDAEDPDCAVSQNEIVATYTNTAGRTRTGTARTTTAETVTWRNNDVAGNGDYEAVHTVTFSECDPEFVPVEETEAQDCTFSLTTSPK